MWNVYICVPLNKNVDEYIVEDFELIKNSYWGTGLAPISIEINHGQ